MEILKIESLAKSFTLHNLNKHIKACEKINFNVNKGEFIGITGKSGSGKSTILKSIYRTYLPEQGSIWYNSLKFGWVNISEISERKMIYLRKYEIGYVSQFLDVLPRTTALEIIEKAVLDMDVKKEFAHKQAIKMLKHFELDKTLWDSYPRTFSGGEKLRLNVSKAMVKKPRLLLLDEPTASLDNYNKQKVKELIEALKEDGTTMLGIFHDLEFMGSLCDKEYSMEEGLLK
ncbi:MAG: phosphonate C-P lyase system protein PhnL [Clostridia bacterium]